MNSELHSELRREQSGQKITGFQMSHKRQIKSDQINLSSVANQQDRCNVFGFLCNKQKCAA